MSGTVKLLHNESVLGYRSQGGARRSGLLERNFIAQNPPSAEYGYSFSLAGTALLVPLDS